MMDKESEGGHSEGQGGNNMEKKTSISDRSSLFKAFSVIRPIDKEVKQIKGLFSFFFLFTTINCLYFMEIMGKISNYVVYAGLFVTYLLVCLRHGDFPAGAWAPLVGWMCSLFGMLAILNAPSFGLSQTGYFHTFSGTYWVINLLVLGFITNVLLGLLAGYVLYLTGHATVWVSHDPEKKRDYEEAYTKMGWLNRK